MSDLVSVIITTYRRKSEFEKAISSIVNQTYNNIELIVVDDNVEKEYSDFVKNIVEQYSSKIKVKYIKNKFNMGGARARNVGIDESYGTYIAFLDDDDWYFPTKIEEQIKCFQNTKCDKLALVYCYTRSVDANENILYTYKNNIVGDFLYEAMFDCIAATSQWLCLKSALEDIGGFQDVPSKQDSTVLLNLALKGYQIDRVPKVLTKYYELDIERISNSFEKAVQGELILLEKLRENYKYFEKKQIKNIEYNANKRIFNDYIKMHNYSSAFKYWKYMHSCHNHYIEEIWLLLLLCKLYIKGKKMIQTKNDMSIKKATILNAISKYMIVIWNVIISIILARILSPKDYGVVAVTTVFTNFFSIFTDMGISTGIIQNKSLTKKEIGGIYFDLLILGIGLSVIFFLTGIPVSYFYKNKAYISLFFLLSILLFVSTLNIVPSAILMKNKRFGIVSVRNVVIALLSSSVAVFLAICGFKYYAIVCQSIISIILTYFFNIYIAHKDYSLGFCKHNNGMKKIWKYSLYQFGFNFVNYFSRNLDNLLISKFFGEIRLGYYNKAYELTTYPISNIVHVITPILHPVLSEYQNQKEYIYMQYIKLVRLLSSIGIFFSAVCFFSCKELIFVLYGEKWIASVVCLKYLSISIWSQMICSSIGVAFQSTGNTRSMLKCGGINTCLSIAAIVIGLISGSLRLFCISIAVAFNLHLVMPFYYLMRDSFQKKMTIIVHELLPDAVILTVLLVTLTFFSKCILIKTSMFFTLIIKVVIVFSIYMILMLITGRYKIWRVIKKI